MAPDNPSMNDSHPHLKWSQTMSLRATVPHGRSSVPGPITLGSRESTKAEEGGGMMDGILVFFGLGPNPQRELDHRTRASEHVCHTHRRLHTDVFDQSVYTRKAVTRVHTRYLWAW